MGKSATNSAIKSQKVSKKPLVTPKKRIQKTSNKSTKSNAKSSNKKNNSNSSNQHVYAKAVKNASNMSKWTKFVSSLDVPTISHPHFGTMCLHAGQAPEKEHGAVNVPIYNSTTFAQDIPGQVKSQYDYTRCGNPSTTAVSEAIAAIDYGSHAMVFSSGCGATTTLMMLAGKDHVLCSDDVYGGTNRLLNRVLKPNFNFDYDMVDLTDLSLVKKAIKKNTKILWAETPTNPTLKIVDVQELAKICKKHNILLVVDNTFATPFIQSPLLLGADISYNSCTKYINGHSDVIAGSIAVKDKVLFDRIHFIAKTIGVNLGVIDSYMLLRGLKTLKMRVSQCSRTAYILAHYLESSPYVTKCVYPGLKSHPQHDLALKQMRGFGGMITFFIKGGKAQSFKFLSSLKLFILAESLGGVESLAECPAVMTHGSVPLEQRQKLGIDDTLIRLSVGMEDTEDLLEDCEQALALAMKAK